MHCKIWIMFDQAIFSNTNALFNKTQLVMIVWTCWQTVEDLLAAAIVSAWLIYFSSISIIIEHYSFIQSICFHSSSFSVILFIYIIFDQYCLTLTTEVLSLSQFFFFLSLFLEVPLSNLVFRTIWSLYVSTACVGTRD